MPSLSNLRFPSGLLDLTTLAGATGQPDVKAAAAEFQKVQGLLLDRLAAGDAALIVTDSQKNGPGSPVGLDNLWGFQAIDRDRWDAVAVWLERGGVLHGNGSRSLSRMIWYRALTPSKDDVGEAGVQGALAQRDRLRQRVLTLDEMGYRREMLSVLAELSTATLGKPSSDQDRAQRLERRAMGVAWADAVLDARPLQVTAFTPQETLDFSSEALRQAILGHLRRAEQRQLEAAIDSPAAPERTVSRPRL